jgi:hypothetical protein
LTALSVNLMGKRNQQLRAGMDLTSVALLVACLGGAGILFYSESTFPDALNLAGQRAKTVPGWQIHMGSTCVAVLAFVVILFLLELLGRRSKGIAWRSSWPWMPLIGLTAMASLIHIPAYAIIPICALYSIWAYRRTRHAR